MVFPLKMVIFHSYIYVYQRVLIHAMNIMNLENQFTPYSSWLELDVIGISHYHIYILVGGLEHEFLFFHLLGIIVPTDFHIFLMDVFMGFINQVSSTAIYNIYIYHECSINSRWFTYYKWWLSSSLYVSTNYLWALPYVESPGGFWGMDQK